MGVPPLVAAMLLERHSIRTIPMEPYGKTVTTVPDDAVLLQRRTAGES